MCRLFAIRRCPYASACTARDGVNTTFADIATHHEGGVTTYGLGPRWDGGGGVQLGLRYTHCPNHAPQIVLVVDNTGGHDYFEGHWANYNSGLDGADHHRQVRSRRRVCGPGAAPSRSRDGLLRRGRHRREPWNETARYTRRSDRSQRRPSASRCSVRPCVHSPRSGLDDRRPRARARCPRDADKRPVQPRRARRRFGRRHGTARPPWAYRQPA